MFSLRTPQYSFVQMTHLNAAQCPSMVDPCLPIYELEDIQFQVFAVVNGDDSNWFEKQFTAGDLTFKYTVYAKICFDCEEELTSLEPFEYSAHWTKISDEDGQQLWAGRFYFSGDNTTFNNIEPGVCWNLCFYRVQVPVSAPNTIIGITSINKGCTYTCFQKINDPCFTTKFRYTNNEDAFNFLYEDSGLIFNQVRVSAYLRDMQLPSQQKVNTRSNGVKKKLFERIEEDYELVIDWMPKQMQKAFKVMLSHDDILLTNTNEGFNSFQRFVCEEKYDIKWPEIPYPQAQAFTRVKRAEALSLINSNCR